jgi:hypothetical protein
VFSGAASPNLFFQPRPTVLSPTSLPMISSLCTSSPLSCRPLAQIAGAAGAPKPSRLSVSSHTPAFISQDLPQCPEQHTMVRPLVSSHHAYCYGDGAGDLSDPGVNAGRHHVTLPLKRDMHLPTMLAPFLYLCCATVPCLRPHTACGPWRACTTRKREAHHSHSSVLITGYTLEPGSPGPTQNGSVLGWRRSRADCLLFDSRKRCCIG